MNLENNKKTIRNDTLKNVQLKADPAVKSGESLQLECDYDLENAQLYSIKWYFGDDEFYRFVPKESPPTRVFPRPGVAVDKSLSELQADESVPNGLRIALCFKPSIHEMNNSGSSSTSDGGVNDNRNILVLHR
ncbi:hypothetical protein PGB90_000512 [Kerria lacca]